MRNQTVLGCWAMILLNGVKSPFEPGTPNAACLILPTIFSYLLNGTPPRALKASFVIDMSLSNFSGSSCSVLSLPSNSHPRISLRTAHAPSSLRSFFNDAGSFSGDSGLAGNTSWMAWRRARDRCVKSSFVLGMAAAMKSSTYTSKQCAKWRLSSPDGKFWNSGLSFVHHSR